MADGTTHRRSLTCVKAMRSTERNGSVYRRYVKTRVLAHWSVIKPAWRVTSKTGQHSSRARSPFPDRAWLEIRDRHGMWQGPTPAPHCEQQVDGQRGICIDPPKDADYRRGYLCGVIRATVCLLPTATTEEDVPRKRPSVSSRALRCRGVDAHAGISASKRNRNQKFCFLQPAAMEDSNACDPYKRTGQCRRSPKNRRLAE